jgi:hypothetical protein
MEPTSGAESPVPAHHALPITDKQFKQIQRRSGSLASTNSDDDVAFDAFNAMWEGVPGKQDEHARSHQDAKHTESDLELVFPESSVSPSSTSKSRKRKVCLELRPSWSHLCPLHVESRV